MNVLIILFKGDADQVHTSNKQKSIAAHDYTDLQWDVALWAALLL